MPFEDAFNFCEKVVRELLLETPETADLDEDTLEDLYCLTLNRLPPRYVRHEADTVFFLKPTDRVELEQKARQAMGEALERIRGD
ncbi:MAG: late competence development ComFB family protein [Wenzhouxiangellaceae bacterium]|nr:late competence development ComFB family protein [Wenzhouxiangellaceae bacterium]